MRLYICPIDFKTQLVAPQILSFARCEAAWNSRVYLKALQFPGCLYFVHLKALEISRFGCFEHLKVLQFPGFL